MFSSSLGIAVTLVICLLRARCAHSSGEGTRPHRQQPKAHAEPGGWGTTKRPFCPHTRSPGTWLPGWSCCADGVDGNKSVVSREGKCLLTPEGLCLPVVKTRDRKLSWSLEPSLPSGQAAQAPGVRGAAACLRGSLPGTSA